MIQYGDVPRTYSGLISVDPRGQVSDWYGKRHLVMFGEYIPLIGSIAGLRNLIPPGLGVTAGETTAPLPVGQSQWLPNICIETAVERIAPAAVGSAVDRGQIVDAIVTVTNDRWFQHTAVVGHHWRAARMVAIASGRPILSAGNGGPTGMIDCDGQTVDSLDHNEDGAVVGTVPNRIRNTWYSRFGDWPWWAIGIATVGLSIPRRSRDIDAT